MNELFVGTGVALVTPFLSDKRIDCIPKVNSLTSSEGLRANARNPTSAVVGRTQ